MKRITFAWLALALALAGPVFADEEIPSVRSIPSRPLQMSELVATIERLVREHPAQPQAAFLLRASLAGMAARLEQQGLPAYGLFQIPLGQGLEADAAAVQAALDRVLAGQSAGLYGEVIWAGLASALASLDDPGSRLYAPGEYQKSLEELGYSLGGVGFFVDENRDARGGYLIVEMIEGFPAERQGIRRGDRLVAVAGRSTSELTFNELAATVRGPVGTRVTISIEGRDGTVRDYTLVREWLNPNPKGAEVRLVEGATGYVKVKYLGHRADLDLHRQIESLVARGARRLVLDLRNCPGPVAGGVAGAGLFLPRGTLILRCVSATQRESFSADAVAPPFGLPLVVLINRYSGAGATVLAGALRDHGRAVVVGEPTRAEEMDAYEKVAEELPDGSVATVTVAYYCLPLGRSLWTQGIRPDVEVALDNPTAGATGLPGDAQFERALQVLAAAAPSDTGSR